MKKIFKLLWKTIGKEIVLILINELFDDYRQKRMTEHASETTFARSIENDLIASIQKHVIDGIEKGDFK